MTGRRSNDKAEWLRAPIAILHHFSFLTITPDIQGEWGVGGGGVGRGKKWEVGRIGEGIIKEQEL